MDILKLVEVGYIMSSPSFKDKFDKLMGDMTTLLNTAEEEELNAVNIKLLEDTEFQLTPVEVNDEVEYFNAWNSCLTGNKKKQAYILQQFDQLTYDDVKYHEKKAKQMGRVLFKPSVIMPEKRTHGYSDYFAPYVLLFTKKSKLLFCLPYEGESFSDIASRSGKYIVEDE